MKTASKFVEEAKKWLGVEEGSDKHKELISIYNSHRPLAHGYKMSTNDAWCAMFVSAISIICGYTDIIPAEIRCSSYIDKFKKKHVWKEDENRTPNVGDIVFYDWEDSGSGNNKGTPNHVGIVSFVDDNTFDVIEGNYNNRVSIRTMLMNGKHLRGFAVPKYDSEPVVDQSAESEPSYYIHKVQKGDTLYHLALDYGATISAIMNANYDLIKNRNLIRVGWELKIPIKG